MENTGWDLKRKGSYSALVARGSRRHQVCESGDEDMNKKRQELMKTIKKYLPSDAASLQKAILNHFEYTLAATRFHFTASNCYRAVAYSVRDRLIESFNDTNAYNYAVLPKRGYYLSLEYLMGRYLLNVVNNLNLENEYKQAVQGFGRTLEELYENETDPALGNGGLGRLAACFLDSFATRDLPVWGYGLRYKYGMFQQKIVDGWQVEYPDYWLGSHNPWEVVRPDVTYCVRFFGTVEHYETAGVFGSRWVGGEIVEAVAHDNPIPGFDTVTCNNLRLWSAVPSREIDYVAFNHGHYLKAVEAKNNAETITSVLYPNDNESNGKILRLKQQYFLCSASLQDILRRFMKTHGTAWSFLPNQVAIQLNDTHPAISIPEFIRLMVDVQNLDWDTTWELTKKVFNYTNHTVLPEALEKWSAELFGKLLPRHLEIINEINRRHIDDLKLILGPNSPAISRMSIYEEGEIKTLRMANLCLVACNKINGVAAIHSNLLKTSLFKDFVDYFKLKGETNKIINITNGITPRRWLACANPLLTSVIDDALGGKVNWIRDMENIKQIVALAKCPRFQSNVMKAKLGNKIRLIKYLSEQHIATGLNPNALCDIMVKRIHEYKRQLMFILFIIYRYLQLKETSDLSSFVPRLCIIGGKAAPGYFRAKSIVKLASDVAYLLENDTRTKDHLRLVFVPNYNVTSAEVLIPASDISEHISTAGTEASGTSNMKFAMNGGRIMGTQDGANIEIAEESGMHTIFSFGAKVNEVNDIREKAKCGNYQMSESMSKVINFIKSGAVCRSEEAQRQIEDLLNSINRNGDGINGDFYILFHDFDSYLAAQTRADEEFINKSIWAEACILNIANSAKFSADRTVMEYATKIWGIKPCVRDWQEIETDTEE